MEIDPRPCMITLKDGSIRTLFEFQHFLELVEGYMGDDASKWLKIYMERAEEAADYTKASVESDLSNYEDAVESNRIAFQDLQEVLQEIHSQIVSPRVDKHAIAQSLIQGSKIIKNQI